MHITYLIYNILTDVQLINLTETIYPEENHEAILQCSIVGLNADETDYDITFYHLPKCEYYQQQLSGQSDSYIIPTNNGTTQELHVPKANSSHSGNYSCIVKLHKDKPEECVLVETPPKTVDIEHTPENTPKNIDTTAVIITVTVVGSVLIFVIIIPILLYVCKKTQQLWQPQQPQPEPRVLMDERAPLNPHNPILERQQWQDLAEQSDKHRQLADQGITRICTAPIHDIISLFIGFAQSQEYGSMGDKFGLHRYIAS